MTAAGSGGVVVSALADVGPRPRRVALGTFDGVHLGHRDVIAGCDTVVTFAPHPMAVVAPDRAPQLLSTVSRRAELVAALGVRELVVVAMDAAFARRSAREFVDGVLVGALGATHVSVGANFAFGHRAQGDAALLARDGRFEVRVAALREAHGQVVCSTRIRRLVAGGSVEAAATLLGAPFAVPAHLSPSRRSSGSGAMVATAAVPDGHLIPGAGRYVCRVVTTDGRDPTAHRAVVTLRGAGRDLHVALPDAGRGGPNGPVRVDFLGSVRRRPVAHSAHDRTLTASRPRRRSVARLSVGA